MIRIVILILLLASISCTGQKTDNISSKEAISKEALQQDSLISAAAQPAINKANMDEITSKSIDLNNPILLEELMGRFDPKTHINFVVIDQKYADEPGRIMHKQAYESFVNMWNHAQKDGIKLMIKSATRNFDYQKGIWERKWTGVTEVGGKQLNKSIPDATERAKMILEYSSMPGTSRHHWGTDIDLNAFENSYFESGNGLKVYAWLLEHAREYGFCQPYTVKGAERPYGYNEEKWHWSYLPVANQYMAQVPNLKYEMIKGFLGSETAEAIQVIDQYILGINQQCKH